MIAWYGTPELRAQAKKGLAQSLATLPVLLPSTHTALRTRIDQWFERQGIKPRVVGEFEDGALLKTFGAAGMGVFPAALMVENDLVHRYNVKRIGTSDDVEEHYYAISAHKKILHPLVQKLLPVA